MVLENFLSEEDIEALKNECYELVDEMDPTEHNTVFSGVKQVLIMLLYPIITSSYIQQIITLHAYLWR